jgi:putative methionine-R-sulfoxide reductase with GAF domain
VVASLHDAGYAWAGLFFVEDGALALGPEAGNADEKQRTSVPVRWQGDTIAELSVDGAAPDDTAFLEHVADLISGYCLVGWDTGGEPWES